MSDENLEIIAGRLREWVRRKFGVWITRSTANKAARFILGESDQP